jgi:hypothetical protein
MSNAQSCRNDLVAVFGGRQAVFLNSRWQFNVAGL